MNSSGPNQGPAAPRSCPVRPSDAGNTPAPLYGAAVAEDPHGLYARLRDEWGPVAPVEIEPGVDAWLVLGYQALLTVTRDEKRFSKDSRRWNALGDGRVRSDSPLLPMIGWRPTLLFADGAEHQRLRNAVSESLNRIDHRQLARAVQRGAEELIDSWKGEDRADLLAQYARRIPLLVSIRLLGLSESDGARLVHAITKLVDSGPESVAANQEFEGILRALVTRKRADPADDLTSWLITHEAGLTDEEVLHQLVVILVAGNEPTTNWIANTLRVVLADSRFRASLAAGRLSIGHALDEVLWRDPPTQNFPGRWAVRDTLLGDARIKAGDMLILGLAGANADPAVRPSGGTFFGNRAHLAWGAGSHACPAQDPARVITRTAVETLLARLPDVELAVPADSLTWRPSPWSRALTALPVRFTFPVGIRPSYTSGETLWTPHPPLSGSTPSGRTSTTRTPDSAVTAPRSWWSFLVGWRPGR